MSKKVTEQTIHQFTDNVRNQRHAMAGAVISASAAEAVALGRACMQISLDKSNGTLDAGDVTARMARMDQIWTDLLHWCDRDATAIAEFVALRDAGNTLAGQQLLCDAPGQISRLSLDAAHLLQDFRPLVHDQVHDDLEMALTLLAGTAQAAMLLLDSNLRHWPDRPLLDQFEPIRTGLEQDIRQLTLVARIR